MAVRKWLFRCFILLLLGSAIGVGIWIHAFMRPAFVRQQLLNYFSENYPEFKVEVGSVYLRLFGGISISDLRVSSCDDPNNTPIIIIPSGILTHDKEALQSGRLVIRKIELNKPKLHLSRDSQGVWNIAPLLRGKSSEVAPTLVAHQASIQYFETGHPSTPIGDCQNAEILIINDPLPVISFQIQIEQSCLGPIQLEGRYDQAEQEWGGTGNFIRLVSDNHLKPLVDRFTPELSNHLQYGQGIINAQVKIHGRQNPLPKLWYEVHLGLTEGRVRHPDLPMPFEDIQMQAICRNGHFIVDNAQARSGNAIISLSLDLPGKPIAIHQLASTSCDMFGIGKLKNPIHPDWFTVSADRIFNRMVNPELSSVIPVVHLEPLPFQPSGSLPLQMPEKTESSESDWFDELESRLHKLDVSIQHLTLSQDLFRRLPAKFRRMQRAFQPDGPTSLQIEFRRDMESWSKKIIILPENLKATYSAYPCPITQIQGRLEQVFCSDRVDQLKLDLTGMVFQQPISIQGMISGVEPEMDIDVRIHTQGLHLDNPELISTLPKPYPEMAKRLHPTGLLDVEIQIQHNAEVRKLYGDEEYNNQFWLTIHNGSLNYESFPYPLQDVNGTLFIRSQPLYPTRLPPTPGQLKVPAMAAPNVGFIEFKDFRAKHNDSQIRFRGRKEPTTGGAVLTMFIEGEQLGIDTDFYQALSQIKLDPVLRTFSPQGKMNCILQARLLQRNDPLAIDQYLPFQPAEDLELNLAFAGPTIQPSFFAYRFDEVAGRVAYQRGQVKLQDMRARHGKSQVQIQQSDILLRPQGGFWADLKSFEIQPFLCDDDLMKALPRGMRTSFQALNPQGEMKLSLTRLVVDDVGGAEEPRFLPGIQVPTNDPNSNRVPSSNSPNNTASTKNRPLTETDSGRRTSTGLATRSVDAKPLLPTIYWDGQIAFHDVSLKTGMMWEHVEGLLASRGIYQNNQLGNVRANWVIDQGRLAKQPVQNLIVRMEIDPSEPDTLNVPMIQGTFYGGELSGKAMVRMEDDFSFELKLNAANLKLEDLAREQKVDSQIHLEGLAQAKLYLHYPIDRTTGERNLAGGGTIEVPHGKLLNLPIILDLWKILKGKPVDKVFFEEAKAEFRIQGDRMLIHQLDLFGNAINLGGQGEMNLDGSKMKLEFYTVLSRANHLLASSIHDVSSAISKAFFRVIITGDLGGKTVIKKEPIPAVVEPMRRLISHMKQQEP